MAIEIDGGCVSLGNGSWKYTVSKRDGEHIYVFTSAAKPEIGDFIQDGVLIPRIGFKIIEDENSKLRKRMRDEADGYYNPYGYEPDNT